MDVAAPMPRAMVSVASAAKQAAAGEDAPRTVHPAATPAARVCDSFATPAGGQSHGDVKLQLFLDLLVHWRVKKLSAIGRRLIVAHVCGCRRRVTAFAKASQSAVSVRRCLRPCGVSL